MKKHLLMKTLLVALVCLVGGTSSVWGADTFLTTWTGQVGTATNSGNFKYATKKVKIAAGETYVYTLTNFNDGNNSNYWKNWVVEGNLGEKYFDCEARGNQWQAGSGPVPSYTPVMAYTDVENFQTAYNGANVTITISRNVAGDQFTITHTSNVLGTTAGNTEKYYGGTWTVAVGAAEEWDIYITEEEAHFVVTSVTYTDADSNETNYNPTYQRGYTTAWSASDAVASGTGTNVWIGNFAYNETYGLHASASGNRSAVMTFNHTANSIQTFDIVFDNLVNTGNSGNYSYLRIGSAIEIRSNQQDQNGAVIINGASTAITDCNVKNYNRGGDKWTIHVEINTSTKEVTALTIVGTTMNSKSAHYTLASATSLGSSPTFNTVTIGFTRVAGTPAAALTSIQIQEEEQTVTMRDYTINYKLGENVVKTVASSSADGTVITALTAIDGEGTYAGNHYLIIANEAPSMTLTSGDNILNVSVRAPYTATLNVTKNIGGVAESPVVTNLTETDAKVCSWAYTYPMYVKKDDVYYIADETSSFGETGTFTNGQSINKTVSYTNPDPLVVYFGEPNETAGGNVSYSNGNTGYITGGVTYEKDDVIRLGVLPAGTYRLITNVTGNEARNVVVGDCTDTSKFPTALVTITSTGAKNEVFTLASATPISISGKDQGGGKFNQSADIDYILVKKVSALVTLDAGGYATFASPYALDVASMTASSGDVTAYKAAVDGTVAKFTALDQTIPANTGILLKGVANATVTIPAVASGTAVDGNVFQVNPTGADLVADAANYYFAMKKDAATLTFAPFAPEGFAFPASKAYLKVSKTNFGSTARELSISFDDDVTSIRSIDNGKLAKDNYYDLQGRKVAQPQKGLYIVNGRKVVVK